MLDSRLSATRIDGAVDLSLTVANTGDDTRMLTFRSGQRAEFVAERQADGEAVWRYSDGRMFTMALEEDSLRPGEESTYSAIWEDPPSGEYVVRAWLVTEDATAEAEATVSVA